MKEARKKIYEKIALWVIFNVTIALLPFVFQFIIAILSRKEPNFENVFKDGELMLVTGAIGAGALGELLLAEKQYIIGKLISGGGCLICLILTSFIYAFIKSQTQECSLAPLDSSAIYSYSLWFFGSTFFAGLGCIILSEIKK